MRGRSQFPFSVSQFRMLVSRRSFDSRLTTKLELTTDGYCVIATETIAPEKLFCITKKELGTMVSAPVLELTS